MMRGESVILLLILFYAAREGNNLVEHDVLIFPSRVTRYIYMLQKIRPVCEAALNEAHKLDVIKTYTDAVKEDDEDEKLQDWAHHPKAVK